MLLLQKKIFSFLILTHIMVDEVLSKSDGVRIKEEGS